MQGRPADREVIEALLHESHHFVAPGTRKHEVGVRFDMGKQGISVLGEPKEVVVFAEMLDRTAMDRAQTSLQEVLLLVVVLTRHAVEPLVARLVDVAPVVEGLQERLGTLFVAVLSGPDEVVVRDLE